MRVWSDTKRKKKYLKRRTLAMKGIIFNLLEQFVSENFDDQTWDDILDQTTLISADIHISPKTYPDEDLVSLVVTANRILDIPVPELLKMFGRFSFPRLLKKYSVYQSEVKNALDFILDVDSVIHVEVKKLFHDAYLPKLNIKKIGKNQLEIEYLSKRKLCAFMEGLILGCTDHFQETVMFTHEVCQHFGDEHCVVVVQFDKTEFCTPGVA